MRGGGHYVEECAADGCCGGVGSRHTVEMGDVRDKPGLDKEDLDHTVHCSRLSDSASCCVWP